MQPEYLVVPNYNTVFSSSRLQNYGITQVQK